ncbi:MAG: NAD(P)H-dependent oxidoreductase [Clostridia bacterium]|nr:NAD(P)H-dependent oxidoreductase [Clostridia bacterium]MBT7123097.1 NAD(P)H-dependent oxidoreductase [Clostridia bacterium]
MNKTKVKKQVMDAYGFRHACKIFDADKKIGDEDFDFVLETAHLSPSSFGFEPWSFVVLQDARIRELLVPYAWGATKQLPTASHFVILLAKKSVDMKHGSDYVRYMMKEIQQLPDDVADEKNEKYKHFQESDFDIADERTMFDWAGKQCYIALGNMMSAAAMIGIDSCPVEGFDRKLLEKVLADEGVLDRQKYGVAVMAGFGYRIKQPREKTRRSKADKIRTV